MCETNSEQCSFFFSLGHLHHRVYVIGVLKAVPKTHQAKCQEVTTAGMEEVVHTDPFSVEVTKFIMIASHLP